MVRRLLAPALILGLLPATVSAQTFSASAAVKNVKFDVQAGASDWQQKYDAAKAKKDGGKKKIFIGLAAIGGGTVLLATGGSPASCTVTTTISCGTNAHAKIGLIADAAGGGIFIWGAVDMLDGNGEMNRLAAQKPKAAIETFTLTDHQAIQIGRSNVAYRLSW